MAVPTSKQLGPCDITSPLGKGVWEKPAVGPTPTYTDKWRSKRSRRISPRTPKNLQGLSAMPRRSLQKVCKSHQAAAFDLDTTLMPSANC